MATAIFTGISGKERGNDMSMLTRMLFRLSMPQSLRRQFSLALLIPVFLIVAGGLISFYNSRISIKSTRQLAEKRMFWLQEAQDLARYTLLIEHELNHMFNTGSVDTLRASYLKIIEKLDLTDSLVLDLGQASDNLSVLDLNQAVQLFRNTIHIVAQLQTNLLTGQLRLAESQLQQALLAELKDELRHQAVCLVETTGIISTQFTQDYIDAMQHVTAVFEKHQLQGLAFLIGCILLAWLVSWSFLRHRVSDRLQKVSDCLRLKQACSESQMVLVHGNDEIGEMARAVEKFLEDRQLLIQTQRSLRDNVAELKKAFEEIKTLRGIIPICSSCKKIRDDKGYWSRIETYIKKHSDADFTHGVCPECIKKLYPDLIIDDD
nr:hypothetical protein [uncultured Desulfobacter sp.]